MSVTAPVSHVEMWPYAASAAALSESQRATAVLMLSVSSALPATASTKLATHRSAADRIIVARGCLKHSSTSSSGFEQEAIHLRAGRRASGTLGESSILKYATKILATYLPLDELGLLARHNAKHRPRDEPRRRQDRERHAQEKHDRRQNDLEQHES